MRNWHLFQIHVHLLNHTQVYIYIAVLHAIKCWYACADMVHVLVYSWLIIYTQTIIKNTHRQIGKNKLHWMSITHMIYIYILSYTFIYCMHVLTCVHKYINTYNIQYTFPWGDNPTKFPWVKTTKAGTGIHTVCGWYRFNLSSQGS